MVGYVKWDYVPFPVTIETVNRFMGLDIQTGEEMDAWLNTVRIPCLAQPPPGVPTRNK